MGLKVYKKKRNFRVTPEPSGGREARGLRFVVQKHAARSLHYDFRLEHKGVLLSWAVPKGPSLHPAEKRLAVRTEDHPLAYRKFHGRIPEGEYGAGQVDIWDQGTYQAYSAKTTADTKKLIAKGLAKGHLKFELHGDKLSGLFSLIAMHSGAKNSWLMLKHDDRYATWATMAETPPEAKLELKKIGTDPMPKHVQPMLATLVTEPFDRPDWLFEMKWDGYRAIAQVRNGKVHLYSRNKQPFNEKFPVVTKALGTIKHDCVLDGEIVMVDKQGRSMFQSLQNIGAAKDRSVGTLLYYVFDLLWLDGHDLRALPLIDRKELLQKLVYRNPVVRFSDHVSEHGQAFFRTVAKHGLEGMVAKNGQSTYHPGVRGPDWLKIKHHQRQETVICGFTQPRRSRNNFGAIVLGVYDHNKLRYIGHSGSGFNEQTLADLHQKMMKLKQATCPISPEPKTNEPAVWIKPKLVCEIEFAGWTDEGIMRQPIFVGLRTDKPATAVQRELAKPAKIVLADPEPAKPIRSGGRAVPVTHTDKVYFPKQGYTKGDVVEYYRSISSFILPYLKDRPENMLRNPGGIRDKGFFHKDVGTMPPDWVKTARIYSDSNKRYMHYLVCNDQATLIYMANLGCIEINPWNSRLQNLDNPDWLVIDLDPEGVTFNDVIEVAQACRTVLESMDITGYPKTSGKTGIHIYLPLGAKYTHGESKEFARLLVTMIYEHLPNLTSIERLPAKRRHRVYLDFLQNNKGQTLAAPYSLRPVNGATVATPLLWSEVKRGLDPKAFTIKTIQRRLDKHGDIFRKVLGPGINIPTLLKKIDRNQPS